MNPFTVTTVLAAAATYDLTDLATAKDELGIDSGDTTQDAWISRAITQVSRSVMTETNRVFAPELVQDVIDVRRHCSQVPNGASVIQLARWPVLGIVSVSQLQSDGTTPALVSGTDYRLDASTGELLRLNTDTGRVTSWEPLLLTVIYSGGYGVLAQEAHVVPATPFQVTVAQAATFSCDQSVAYASGTLLTRVAASPTVGQYAVNSMTGLYTFAAADTLKPLSFAYCALAVPPDLIEIALRVITGRSSNRGRDPSLIERNTPGVGTQRWWFGAAPGQDGPFTPDIAGALDRYRVPVAA